ncbi:2,3-dihydro-2,3-dihydroxybenzoate dehydrogenase [Streptomyces sp. NPDC001904]|uniref:2,3-dihydro-2,3-dihydroxybenzoate dehydrogenase n=1 Tax=Streptomyces sp. NPDC001904 TaxID=3154531 RepID=UPI0033295F69
MTPKTALVTGAAGGIGRAVVHALAAGGTRVVAVDLDATRLRKATADVSGAEVVPLAADVVDPMDSERAVKEAQDEVGPLDALVNVAGVLRTGRVEEFHDDDWAAMFAANVDGVFRMSRAAVRRMVPRRSGSIITIASNAARTPRSGMAAYAASKAAAEMFTKSLGLEVAEHGIRCNVVAPGSTETSMLTGMWHDPDGRRRTIEGDVATYKNGIPLRKLARPEDIADAVCFLLSDRASHITLETLTVDGGAILGV